MARKAYFLIFQDPITHRPTHVHARINAHTQWHGVLVFGHTLYHTLDNVDADDRIEDTTIESVRRR